MAAAAEHTGMPKLRKCLAGMILFLVFVLAGISVVHSSSQTWVTGPVTVSLAAYLLLLLLIPIPPLVSCLSLCVLAGSDLCFVIPFLFSFFWWGFVCLSDCLSVCISLSPVSLFESKLLPVISVCLSSRLCMCVPPSVCLSELTVCLCVCLSSRVSMCVFLQYNSQTSPLT